MNMVHWTPPPLRIWASDLHRLQQLAASAESTGHPAAYFLLSELNRADPHNGRQPPTYTVAVNRWVTFAIDGMRKIESRLLVLPEDCVDAETHLSVLSPIGAALIGLPQGSRMPYVDFDGELKIVTVEAVRHERLLVKQEIAVAMCTVFLLIIWVTLASIYR